MYWVRVTVTVRFRLGLELGLGLGLVETGEKVGTRVRVRQGRM